MLQQLRAWLNGSREYLPGVLLYNQLGDNDELKALFKKGKTDYCNKRLQMELLAICNELKNQDNDIESFSVGQKTAKTGRPVADRRVAGNIAAVENANPELYAACKSEANKVYKETMNTRAVLFAMVPADNYENPNRQDLVEARKNLALNVVTGSIEYSRLYDRADYVRIHGKLPDQTSVDEQEIENIPDHQVKQKLDNARKALNKIKGREQTPERVALVQKHQLNIEKLEAKWHSLQPKK